MAAMCRRIACDVRDSRYSVASGSRVSTIVISSLGSASSRDAGRRRIALAVAIVAKPWGEAGKGIKDLL